MRRAGSPVIGGTDSPKEIIPNGRLQALRLTRRDEPACVGPDTPAFAGAGRSREAVWYTRVHRWPGARPALPQPHMLTPGTPVSLREEAHTSP